MLTSFATCRGGARSTVLVKKEACNRMREARQQWRKQLLTDAYKACARESRPVTSEDFDIAPLQVDNPVFVNAEFQILASFVFVIALQ